MGQLPKQSTAQQTQDNDSLLSQVTLYFEYNKTIHQAKQEIRSSSSKN